MRDKVTIKCYGSTEIMNRKDAENLYLESMCACEGAERERYSYIYCCLKQGDKYIDGDNY